MVVPKQETHFTIDATEAGAAPLDVSLMDDYGEQKPLWKDQFGTTDPNDGGIMAIKLLKGKELVKADLIGKSDPYAVIRHGAQKYTTKANHHTINNQINKNDHKDSLSSPRRNKEYLKFFPFYKSFSEVFLLVIFRH